jgi:D-alanyl-lipoteichoic acid acyltransferase DltB (MBOAT superfamily)
LLIVALVSGLWHGAAWHFIVWGALHGIYLVTERALMRKDNPASRRLLSIVDTESLVPDLASVLCMLRTFTLACIGWVFFRAQTVGDGLNIVWRITTAMFHARFYADVLQLVQSWSPALAALGALILIEWWNRKSWNPFAIAHKPFLLRWAAYTMVCWYLLLFGTHQTEEFIYFQF